MPIVDLRKRQTRKTFLEMKAQYNNDVIIIESSVLTKRPECWIYIYDLPYDGQPSENYTGALLDKRQAKKIVTALNKFIDMV
jgi:hypothetical protein